jgi:TP53 regulating kinase and related kinases
MDFISTTIKNREFILILMNEIGRGAEAVVFYDEKTDTVHKTRPQKQYRLAVIDAILRKRRTKMEASILEKLAKKGVLVPKLITKDTDALVMEFLEGMQVKELLDTHVDLAEAIGRVVAQVHALDIVHGDLTTSNMILKDKKVYLIDFGLSYHSKRIEDKAVDLHLFLQALESKHFRVKDMAWLLFKKGYAEYAKSEEVLKQLDVVEMRGRHKTKGGG